MNINNGTGYFLFGVFLFFVVFVLILRTAFALSDFLEDLKIINTEIKRTKGRERRLWKKEKNKFWLTLFFP